MAKKLVPKDFAVPEVLETDKFCLRMLTTNDADKDYDAVITSIDHLQKMNVFGPSNRWPATGITFDQDLRDLGWHQKEFQNKTSFAYTVMSLDEEECLGCVYIYPSKNPEYDAIVMLWVRQSEAAKGLDGVLYSTVKNWVHDQWPFKKVAYPGRDVGWEDF